MLSIRVARTLFIIVFALSALHFLRPHLAHAIPGDLDPSFGVGGIVTIADGGVTRVAIQADGKIVAAGSFDSAELVSELRLVRLNRDGTFDTSFGTDGTVSTGISNYLAGVSLVLQPDGKVVVASSLNRGSGRPDFVLARYNAHGSPDPDFGTGGKVVTNLDFDNHGFGSADDAFGLAIQTDGKLVAVGGTFIPNGGPAKFAVARYNSDGSLDGTFGTGGIVITFVCCNGNTGYAVAVQSNGKIIVGGASADRGSVGGFTLLRYNNDGSLDETFGTGGVVVTPNSGTVEALVIQADAKLVAAGTIPNASGGADIAMVRYNSDGSLDQTFGADGIVITHYNSPITRLTFAVVRGLVLQADGKLVAAGGIGIFGESKLALIRYHPNGGLDEGFGTAGTVLTDFGVATSGGTGVAVQTDGKLVAAGEAFFHRFVLARYQGRSNEAPVADAGPDQSANEGALVQLDGTGSHDPDGDPLTYQWTQLAGPSATLDLSDPAHPTFTAPGVSVGGATMTFSLTVGDGMLTSAPDEVNVNVKNVNHVPVADAGPDQTVNEAAHVTLDATASFDVDGDPLTFAWVQTVGPAVVLSDGDAARPTFTAPFVGPAGARLTFELTVGDGADQATDTVTVILENVNHDPVADAGRDQTRNERALVTLDGTASSDPDGDTLTYSWAQLSGSPVAISDVHSPSPSFTAPRVGPGGEVLTFRLDVDDRLGGHATASVTILVQNVNDPPVCDAGRPSQSLLWPPNHRLVRVGIVGVTDPENDRIRIAITRVTQDEPVNGLGDGDTTPDAVIDGETVLLRAERSGRGNGRVYRVEFSADDGAGGACSGSVIVGVPHDMKGGRGPIDDGQFFASTVP